jgi:hypothetical protein
MEFPKTSVELKGDFIFVCYLSIFSAPDNWLDRSPKPDNNHHFGRNSCPNINKNTWCVRAWLNPGRDHGDGVTLMVIGRFFKLIFLDIYM